MTAIPRDASVFVAGHAGLVGSAIVRALTRSGFDNLLTARRDDLDLRDQSAVNQWFAVERPQYVYVAAGTVGGILPNSTRPAEFLYNNLLIHSTIVHAAYENQVHKLLYLGSSCIYPREAVQPITEDQLLTGTLEPTNEAYALAKIAGIKMCQAYHAQYGCNFISAMPTNLYGPNDNFDLATSHVLPALMRKFHEAKLEGRTQVEIWGSGTPVREFLHVDDLADLCLHLMEHYDDAEHINAGTGEGITIRRLAETVRDIVHPSAELVFDASKPDGMPHKVLDVSRLSSIGWQPKISFEDGVRSTYEWFVAHAPDGVRGMGAMSVTT